LTQSLKSLKKDLLMGRSWLHKRSRSKRTWVLYSHTLQLKRSHQAWEKENYSSMRKALQSSFQLTLSSLFLSISALSTTCQNLEKVNGLIWGLISRLHRLVSLELFCFPTWLIQTLSSLKNWH
jgi:hypothetical protein